MSEHLYSDPQSQGLPVSEPHSGLGRSARAPGASPALRPGARGPPFPEGSRGQPLAEGTPHRGGSGAAQVGRGRIRAATGRGGRCGARLPGGAGAGRGRGRGGAGGRRGGSASWACFRSAGGLAGPARRQPPGAAQVPPRTGAGRGPGPCALEDPRPLPEGAPRLGLGVLRRARAPLSRGRP